MASEVQASPSPRHSPPEPGHGAAADPPPPLPPTRDESPPPLSTPAAVSSQPQAAAAKYVPPRAASRTAGPDPGRSADGGWYSWNGGRPARPAPPSRWQRAEEVPPPPPPPSAPAPVPRPTPAPAPPPPAVRPVDRVVMDIMSRKRCAAALQRALLAARGSAAGLCLAALAVLAADTRKGWALDSYNRYSQFQYVRYSPFVVLCVY
jgi:hypothetical protein